MIAVNVIKSIIVNTNDISAIDLFYNKWIIQLFCNFEYASWYQTFLGQKLLNSFYSVETGTKNWIL